jgi:Na+-translocating ferredoxin:NAD+ oxidoreductase subunit A
MHKYFLLAIGAALTNNIVLVKILGLCPAIGGPRKLEASIGIGLATAFSLTLVATLGYLVNEYVLAPLEIEYLRTLLFILLAAACAVATDAYLRRTQPVLAQSLGIYLPLSAFNCAVLGVPFLGLQERYRLAETIFFAIGSAAGFVLALILLASLRDRLEGANIPAAFRGSAIALITAGLLSLGFMGFNGLVK